MTPTEIKNGLKEIAENSRSKGKLAREAIEYIERLETKMEKIENLEKENRIIRLPCKPNDVYYHCNWYDGRMELNIELHDFDYNKDITNDNYREIDDIAIWE